MFYGFQQKVKKMKLFLRLGLLLWIIILKCHQLLDSSYLCNFFRFLSGHRYEKSLNYLSDLYPKFNNALLGMYKTININKDEQATIPLPLCAYSVGLRSRIIINIYWSIPFGWTHPTIKLFASALLLNVYFYFWEIERNFIVDLMQTLKKKQQIITFVSSTNRSRT